MLLLLIQNIHQVVVVWASLCDAYLQESIPQSVNRGCVSSHIDETCGALVLPPLLTCAQEASSTSFRHRSREKASSLAPGALLAPLQSWGCQSRSHCFIHPARVPRMNMYVWEAQVITYAMQGFIMHNAADLRLSRMRVWHSGEQAHTALCWGSKQTSESPMFHTNRFFNTRRPCAQLKPTNRPFLFIISATMSNV